MNPVMFRLELDDPARAQEVAELVEARLGALQVVELAQAEPEELGNLAPSVTGVAAAVVLTTASTERVAHVRRFIDELTVLVGSLRGVRRAVVVVGAEEVELDQLSDKQLAEIVE